MDTRLATKQVRTAEWAAIIQDCKANGLKIDDYCQLHGISRNAYFYWLRKVKAAALEQARFVEMPTISTPCPSVSGTTAFHTQMVIEAGSMTLRVNADTPSELLQRVLELVCHAE